MSAGPRAAQLERLRIEDPATFAEFMDLLARLIASIRAERAQATRRAA